MRFSLLANYFYFQKKKSRLSVGVNGYSTYSIKSVNVDGKGRVTPVIAGGKFELAGHFGSRRFNFTPFIVVGIETLANESEFRPSGFPEREDVLYGTVGGGLRFRFQFPK